MCKKENIGFSAGLQILMFVIPELGMNLNKNAFDYLSRF
jgi:hypothetical protein